MKKLLISVFLLSLLSSCSSKSCKINYQEESELFNSAVTEIHSLNIRMDSREPYYRIVKSFSKETSPIQADIFNQIEFVECHEDGTIIFQAPNCSKESDFRDEVYFVAFSPLGKSHIKRKRNISKLEELEELGENWFLGTHIFSLAN